MSVEVKDIKDAPNLNELKERFGVSEETLIVAYGDAIYCPKGGMSADLLQHELVHCERQGFNRQVAKRWWEFYLSDDEFRLHEEVVAFKAQYEYCKKVYKDRNRQTKILYALAQELASPMYGSLLSPAEARLWISGKMKK